VSHRCEFREQRLGLFEVRRIEALCEPAVDRREQIERLGAAALIAPETGEARRRAKLKRTRLLRTGDFERAFE
jgi:hypothetical protein